MSSLSAWRLQDSCDELDGDKLNIKDSFGKDSFYVKAESEETADWPQKKQSIHYESSAHFLCGDVVKIGLYFVYGFKRETCDFRNLFFCNIPQSKEVNGNFIFQTFGKNHRL